MSNAALTLQPDWLDTAARSFPEQLGLSFQGREWTFSAMRRVVGAVSATLSKHHTGSGRIGILAANRPGVVFAVHAARRTGAEIVLLNWRQTASEIAWQVADADIEILIADLERRQLALTACVDRSVSVLPIEEMEVASSDIEHSPSQQIDLSRVVAILYTSGTGGRPKGAKFTGGNLWASAVASALHLGHHQDDLWLDALPLFHIGGLAILYRSVITGTPVILHEGFDPDQVNDAIDSGATLASFVPIMLQRMMQRRGDRPYPATLRTVLLGGSSAPASLVEEALQRGIPIAPTYGLTEAASQVTTLLPTDVRRKPGSSGLPLPGTQVRTTVDGRVARSGELGQIEVRGPTVFAGYLGEAGAAADWTADGWFRTGDVGYLDEDGYLTIVDRRDDLIISGGENIYPAEVERVLLQHPDVLDAGVVAVPDETWGTRPVAAVVWRGDAEFAAERVLDHCRERLASFKIPLRIHVRVELPRSPSGKLRRRELREQLSRDTCD